MVTIPIDGVDLDDLVGHLIPGQAAILKTRRGKSYAVMDADDFDHILQLANLTMRREKDNDSA